MATFFPPINAWTPGQALSKAQIPMVFKQAIALHQRGQIQAAQILYERILGVDQTHIGALQMLGTAAAQSGQFELAVQRLDQVLAIAADKPEIHIQRAYALQQVHRYTEALASYDLALELQPNQAETHNNRGVVLHALQRLQDALLAYDRALELKPGYAQAHFNKGNALLALKRRNEALECLGAAIALQPDYAKAYINRGVALQELQRPGEALLSYEKAVALQPFMPEAHFNRGGALQALCRLDESIAAYDKAIALRSDYADAHLFKATALLLQGQFAAGWRNYEWRWKTDDAKSRLRSFAAPQWTGVEPLSGKTILLHCEQGLGDVIQFCRYASVLKRMGASVVLEVHRPLITLLNGLDGVDTCLALGDALPAFDFHCPLLSLPLALQTDLESIPTATSYLNVKPERTEYWRNRLGTKVGLRVGMVWSGNPAHAVDYNRSIALADWLRHAGLDVEWVSLQKEVRDSDRLALDTHGVRHFGSDLRDMADTAALCKLMDVVVSVDTSVAHLSAALGCPTWILLPKVPDWRWLLGRNDSPWYPSVRLYRQTVDGDWVEVLSRLRADLARANDTPQRDV